MDNKIVRFAHILNKRNVVLKDERRTSNVQRRTTPWRGRSAPQFNFIIVA